MADPIRPTDAAGASQPLVAVFTTVGSRDDAQRLAHAMVEQRLVACAQIDEITSVYHWQGAVQQEPEWRLMLKTTAERWRAAEVALRALHPYALPALYALPIAEVSADYARWVAEMVAADATAEPRAAAACPSGGARAAGPPG